MSALRHQKSRIAAITSHPSITVPDSAKVAAVIRDTAEEKILPRFRALERHEIEEKKPGEYVTIADRECEQLLALRLQDLAPGSRIVAEEEVHETPSILARVEEEGLVWILDPLDGTGNFTRGNPAFAVMVALVNGDVALAAWIYEPVTGRMAIAERGAGAWLEGTRLQVAASVPLAEMRGTLHAGTFASRALKRQVDSRRRSLNILKSLRCAGLEYVRLASGEMHFSLFTRLMPWDHVPGVLVHAEAGGVGLCLDGSPYRASRYRSEGVMMAPDREAWNSIHGVLFDDQSFT